MCWLKIEPMIELNFLARSEHMTSVLFSGTDELIGKIVKVKISLAVIETLYLEKLLSNLKQKVA